MTITLKDDEYVCSSSVEFPKESSWNNTAGLIVSHEYTNYCPFTVYVKHQNNLTFAVAPNTINHVPQAPNPHIEMRIVYKLTASSGIMETLDILHKLQENRNILTEEARELKEQLMLLYARDGGRMNKSSFQFSLIRRIWKSELETHAEVYFKESDVVISTTSDYVDRPHPSNPLGFQYEEIRSSKVYSGCFGVFISCVDNEGVAKMRYYYSGRRLIGVPSVVDNSRDSGVYYTVTNSDPEAAEYCQTYYITFAQAEKDLGLFIYKEDAMTNGNPEQVLAMEESKNRVEEKRLILETTRIKSETDQKSAAIERDNLDLKRELERARHENTMMKEAVEIRKVVREEGTDENKLAREAKKLKKQDKAERKKHRRDDYWEHRNLHRKDYYENRSAKRKDTSEWLKFIPSVIAGGIGLYAVYRSSQKA